MRMVSCYMIIPLGDDVFMTDMYEPDVRRPPSPGDENWLTAEETATIKCHQNTEEAQML